MLATIIQQQWDLRDFIVALQWDFWSH